MAKQMTTVHVNGVGGKGMAPLAALALQSRWAVSGDDIAANHRTNELSAAGVDILIGTNSSGPEKQKYLATNLNQPIAAETQKKTRIVTRLGLVNTILKRNSKKQICITGSFGKSTAAGMLFQTLQDIKPSVYMGACLPGTLCGGLLDKGEYAVVEACEYKNAYFDLEPWAILHLNTYRNHEDFFGEGVDGFERSLVELIKINAAHLKHIVTLNPSRLMEDAAKSCGIPFHSVGFGQESRWKIEISVRNSERTLRVIDTAQPSGHVIGPITVPRGVSSFLEVLAGIAVISNICGLSSSSMNSGIIRLSFPERRCEVFFEDERVILVDDNARHPAQVQKLIETLNELYSGQKLILAEPWGKKNQRDLSEWAAVLRKADMTVLMPVGDCSYKFGGAELPDAHSRLRYMISSCGGRAIAVDDEGDVPSNICDWLSNGAKGKPVLVSVGYDTATLRLKEILRKVAKAGPTMRPGAK